MKPSPLRYRHSPRGPNQQQSLALFYGFQYRDATERWPSAAARDHHSASRKQDYLRNMLSRRQLQGFVMLERFLTDNHDDLSLPHISGFTKHILINMRMHRQPASTLNDIEIKPNELAFLGKSNIKKLEPFRGLRSFLDGRWLHEANFEARYFGKKFRRHFTGSEHQVLRKLQRTFGL
jgi:hypothetical protein